MNPISQASHSKLPPATPALVSKAPPSPVSAVAQTALKEGKKPVSMKLKDLCLRVKHGFESIGKKIIALFKDIFCCCMDDVFEEEGEEESSLTETTPKNSKSRRKDTRKQRKGRKNPVPPPTPTPLQIHAEEVTLRESLLQNLPKLAEGLAKSINPSVDGPSGIPNLGNTCYMNAALQNLENLYRNDPSLAELLTQGLSLKKGEKIFHLEERLKTWAPILELEQEKRKRWEEKKERLEESLKNCKDAVAKLKLEKDLAMVCRDLRGPEDKILFKWSFLLLLQAKRYNQSLCREAAALHLDIAFLIGRYIGFEGSKKAQQDTQCYLEIFHDVLEINHPIRIYHTTFYNGELLASKSEPLPETLMRLDLPTGKISKIKLKIAKAESYKLRELKGEANNLKATKHSLLQKRTKSSENYLDNLDVKINALEKEIENLKSERVKELENKKTRVEDSNFLDVINGYFNSPAASDEENQEVSFPDPKDTEKVLMLQPRRERHKFIGAPNFLIAYYSRFDKSGTVGVKDNMPIKLGFDDPSKPFKLNEKADEEYRFTGFIHHSGSVVGGHYMAYIERNGKWFFCNDSSVTEVSKEMVLDEVKQAYILFFKKEPSGVAEKV